VGRWHGSGLSFILTILLIAGMTAACGSAEEQTGASDSSGSADEDPEGNGGQNGDETDEEAESLTWVPFGPSDPDFPTPSWPAYNAFADGKCSALEAYTSEQDLGDVGRAMVALCFAAVEGQEDRWDEVAELADADPSPLVNDCLEPIVSELIHRAVAWHEQNPGETPEVQFERVGGQTPCGEQSAEQNGTDGGGEAEFSEEPEPSEASPAPDVSRADHRRVRGSGA
jgi:hypothetical protein